MLTDNKGRRTAVGKMVAAALGARNPRLVDLALTRTKLLPGEDLDWRLREMALALRPDPRCRIEYLAEAAANNDDVGVDDLCAYQKHLRDQMGKLQPWHAECLRLGKALSELRWDCYMRRDVQAAWDAAAPTEVRS